jgi:hypothetical protein
MTPSTSYYRDVLLFVCGGAAVFGLVVLATLAPFQTGTRRTGKRIAGFPKDRCHEC